MSALGWIEIEAEKMYIPEEESTLPQTSCVSGGISTDPSKIDEVANWSESTSRKEVQRFLRFANYYRRFIRDVMQIAKPLH